MGDYVRKTINLSMEPVLDDKSEAKLPARGMMNNGRDNF